MDHKCVVSVHGKMLHDLSCAAGSKSRSKVY